MPNFHFQISSWTSIWMILLRNCTGTAPRLPWGRTGTPVLVLLGFLLQYDSVREPQRDGMTSFRNSIPVWKPGEAINVLRSSTSVKKGDANTVKVPRWKGEGKTHSMSVCHFFFFFFFFFYIFKCEYRISNNQKCTPPSFWYRVSGADLLLFK